MKKNILITITLLVFINCKGENTFTCKYLNDTICDVIYIKTENYEGIIFGKYCLENWVIEKNRWTPTEDNIEIAEILIKKYILKQVKRKGLINQYNSPIIHLNFDKYLRQYMGYLNKHGERIIRINCFWKDYESKYYPDWKTRWIEVFDGGSYYWQIEVNIDKKKCFDYDVNG